MKKHILFSLLIFSLPFLKGMQGVVFAQPGALDLSFNPAAGANTEIRAVAIQSDGKIIIGGAFNFYNGSPGSYIARLLTNGSFDSTFNVGTGTSSYVHALALQPDGKIIVGGEFSSYNGIPVNALMRLNTDGTMDTTFHTGTSFNQKVFSIYIQNNGKILAGGLFTAYNGTPCGRIIRMNTDGSIDTTFHPLAGANGSVQSITVQPWDNKIIIGGDFDHYDTSLCFRIARINTDGLHDSTFNTLFGADAVVYDLTLQTDLKLIAVGNFDNIGFIQPRHKIARIQTDAALDATFNPGLGANSHIFQVHVMDNGNMLIAGNFTLYNGDSINRIVLLKSNALRDYSFNPGTGASANIFAMKLQTNGKIIIAGSFTSYNGITRNRIARLYNCLTQQPDSIYGNGYALCNGTQQTYSIMPVTGATKYEWILPTGWLGSSDSTSITATSTGTGGIISVKAFTDSCGYSYATTRNIATIQPANVALCLVTVDTASTHNILIWEKPVTALIDSFVIYRETQTNIYTKIAAVPYDSLSEYHDYAANPNTTSFRYKLSVLDTCGAESDLSPFHNTIHLQNLGTGNFQWTFYQIENASNPVLSFNVYRDAFGNGNFFPIGNIPGTNATFTDVSYSSFPNSIYVVDANWSISCTPTRAVNTTRSNIKHINAIDITPQAIDEIDILNRLQIYPNPAGNAIHLLIPEPVQVNRIQLFNTLGQLIKTFETSGSNSLDIQNIPTGVYTLCIETNLGKANKKFVKE